MSKPGQLRHRVTTFITAFVETASVLSAILTILAFLGAGTLVIAFVVHLLILIVPSIGILFMTGVLFFVFRAILEKKKQIPDQMTSQQTLLIEKKTIPLPIDTIQFPPPPEENVAVLSKEIVYEYLEDGKTMYQRKHLKIQMLRNGIHFFQDHYRWTGRGKCVVKSLTPGFAITNQHEEEDNIWHWFDVSFSHLYHKGEVVEFTIEWEMMDEERKALPFLSTVIDRETEYLFMQVRLPRQLTPTRAYLHEYANFIDTLPSITRPIRYNPAARSITYEMSRPKKYHKYLIRWYYD